MKGQWSGDMCGTNDGSVLVNIDEREELYSGVVYFFDKESSYPALAAHFEITLDDVSKGYGSFDVKSINPLRSDNFTEVSINPISNESQPGSENSLERHEF